MANEEEDEQALSQAVDTILETTRAGRTAKASEKVIKNREQAKASDHRGGSSHGGSRGERA